MRSLGMFSVRASASVWRVRKAMDCLILRGGEVGRRYATLGASTWAYDRSRAFHASRGY